MTKTVAFKKEKDLCAEFIKLVPNDWTIYPETGGFDILLVRKVDGFQIGIEAKLKLNAKVIGQAAEFIGSYYNCSHGPDCRAVLVPDAGGDLSHVCRLLGLEVISLRVESIYVYRGMETEEKGFYRFSPTLPRLEQSYQSDCEWFEFAPVERLRLPGYVPDTGAGDKSPITLTHWKINAMKLAILLDKRGYLTRKDFKDIGVSISRWIGCGLLAWLVPGKVKGCWVKSASFPDFSAQHPVNYKQIEADFDEWNPRKENELLIGIK